MDSTSKTLGALPDQLSEMTPRLKGTHVWGGQSVEVAHEVVEFAIVPEVTGSHLDSTGRAQLLSTTGYSPHGNILTIALISLVPENS